MHYPTLFLHCTSTTMGQILEYTPLDEIPTHVQRLKDSFHTHKYDDVQVRLGALRDLYYAVKDNEDELINAIKKDQNKSEKDFRFMELSGFYSELFYVMSNLRKWVQGRKPDSKTPLLFKLAHSKIEYTPLGTVLVIGAYNFPVVLTLQPIIGAIAGGNTVVLKQSEQVPHVSAVITKILSERMDGDLIQCIDGGVEETTKLLDQKLDKVLYTGSGVVGKVIAQKCAETLTPCIMELGGKSPAFVTKNCKDLDIAAKRIVYTKFLHAGQICLTVDYCLVDRTVYDEFLQLLTKWTKELYGNVSPDTYNKIVNTKNTKRVVDLVKQSTGTLVYGGDYDIDKRYIQPTIIKDVSFSDILMKDEIFGPVLPVIPYDHLDEAIGNVISHWDTPLGLYAFSKSPNDLIKIKTRIRSGGFLANDCLSHAAIPQTPFGGIGSSGYGNYHGFNSFLSFSHERATLNQPYWLEPLFAAKYPNAKAKDVTRAQAALALKPWFGRTGKVGGGSLSFVRRKTIPLAVGGTLLYVGYLYTHTLQAAQTEGETGTKHW